MNQQMQRTLTVQQQRDALGREREAVARERAAMAQEANELQKQRSAMARAASEQRQRDAIARAAGDVQRCQAILTHAEAEGRRTLAEYFAYETDDPIEKVTAALAKAGFEPGSAPAIALEEQAIADRILGKSRGTPKA
jgi:hypothetical protein